MSKKQSTDYHALAKARGFKWVGVTLPPKVHRKTLWECSQGHRWGARYNDIQQGRGCRACTGQTPKTKSDYHALAKSRGIRWVGKNLPPNTHHDTHWECPQGHQWSARYGSIQQGGGCPKCEDISRRSKKTWICHSCGKKMDKWEVIHGPDGDYCARCYNLYGGDW